MENLFMIDTYPTVLSIMKKYCKEDILEVRNSFNDLIHIIGQYVNDDGLLNEFRYVCFANKIIISRVSFINQRQGCFTEIMQYLYDKATKYDIHCIIIQSVLSSNMAQWCGKHKYGLVKSPYDFPIFIDDTKYKYGDYVKLIS